MNGVLAIPKDIEAVIDRIDRRSEPGLLPRRDTPLGQYDDLMKRTFPSAQVVNLTEFEYGRSFRYTITLSQNPDASALDQAVLERAVRAEGAIDEVSIAISAVAPYAHVRFCRREVRDGEIVTRWSEAPLSCTHAQVLSDLLAALDAAKVRRIDPAVAATLVPDVRTELCDEGEATVADCLFYG